MFSCLRLYRNLHFNGENSYIFFTNVFLINYFLSHDSLNFKVKKNMGMAYPQYFLNPEQLALINQIVEKIKADNFTQDQLKRITHRPLRPEELNTSLTMDTRVYNMTMTAASAWSKLCADAAAAAITVPTGSVYLLFGWIVVDQIAEQTQASAADWLTIGLDAVGQIKVNGVLRNEVCLKLVDKNPNNMILTLDQIVVATEQTTLLVQAKGTDNGEAIVFPLAYRIGPKSQLDVT